MFIKILLCCLHYSSKNIGGNAYTSGNHVLRTRLAERDQIEYHNPSSRLKFVQNTLTSLNHVHMNCRTFSQFLQRAAMLAVLAIAIPSVCPSVTCLYCVKTTARSTVQFALSDSKMCLVL